MRSSPLSFEELKTNISNHMALSFETDGFSALVGKIFVQLLFAPKPMSLQEIAEQLGVTKAAVSVQVRTLEKQLMCHKLPTSSNRKDYYYISEDFSMTAVQSVITKVDSIQKMINATLIAFSQLNEIGEAEQASHDASKRRFLEMQALHELFLTRLDGLEEEWSARRAQFLLTLE